MKDEANVIVPKCNFLDCGDICIDNFNSGEHHKYCSFHKEGGIFGTGESYEQYQIIENDFINFIKHVPLCKEHYDVHSPILRDIIIRTCVQIEIFFKEWGKEECSKDSQFKLWGKYRELNKDKAEKGVKNWTIKEYFEFSSVLNRGSTPKIYVRILNENIDPFLGWTAKVPMKWWSIYNNIKHAGHTAKNQATLEVALNALAGLFKLHCVQYESLSYLKKFSSITISGNKNDLKINTMDITTPIDSKQYLFKAFETGGDKIEIATIDNIKTSAKKSRII